MLKHTDDDTIVALSTPPGEGGIGVVRLSGSEALTVADRIFKSASGKRASAQEHMTAQYGHIVRREGEASKKIDEVLLLVMKAPKSYTREDVVEISGHGGSAVLSAVIDAAVGAGARVAERGEFTKRAFLNGRLDLIQAEAVLDLIRAKTELGREWAVAQLDGALSRKMREVKNELIEVLSHVEASIDFPDDFLTPDSCKKLEKRLAAASDSIKTLLESARAGFIAQNGMKVVIAGRPNVGKSSLLNALCRKDRAIVTPFPGTTRDVVGEEISIGGFPVRFYDTAGIHDTDHPIEKEGIERSKREAADADLILYVLDASQPVHPDDQALAAGLKDRPVIFVLNKIDLGLKASKEAIKNWMVSAPRIEECSSIQEGGTSALEAAIKDHITQGKASTSEEGRISTVRQKEFLEKTCSSLDRARQSCLAAASPELIAVDLRAALQELGMLAGEVYTDDILEVLFKQFCIGK